MRAPIIAVSPNSFPAEDRRFYKNKALEYGDASMARAVRMAGGMPVMTYRAGSETAAEMAEHAGTLMDSCHALVLTGGTDVAPETYGAELKDPRWAGDPLRDRWEIALYRAALERGRPVLGICRGAQVLNVAEGGTLCQDLLTLREGSQMHRSQELYDELGHPVDIEPDSQIAGLFLDEPHQVNSVHHQGLDRVPDSLRVVARAPDGVIEAVEHRERAEVLGVQWHPEWMQDRESQRRLFQNLVAKARAVAV